MPLGQCLTTIPSEMTSTQGTKPSPRTLVEEPPLADSLDATPLRPDSAKKRSTPEWAWQSDGLVTIMGTGGSDELTIGKRFEATCVPTSALAPSYASKSTDRNVGRRDDGIWAATALTYQRLRQEATSWRTFLQILQANPILSVMRTRKTNAHDCKPAVFNLEDTIRMVGMRSGPKRTPDEITSLLEKWIASLLIELAPTPIQEDLQKACERLTPAFRSMANAFCETQSVGKIGNHQEYSRIEGRAGTLERYYNVTDNGLLRYPDAEQPCIVAHGVTIKGVQSFKYRPELSRSSFEITAELHMAIFHVFDDLTPRRVWKILTSNQTGSVWEVRASQRMVQA